VKVNYPSSFFFVFHGNTLLMHHMEQWTSWRSLSPIRRGFTSGFINYKKGALDSQPQVIKFISCLPMFDGSLRVLRLLQPLKLVNWKMSYVIPLFRKGDNSLISNYRPVALLCCISKVLEKIVYKHLYNHLHQNLLLYKFQSGFLPGHSTNHQLIELYYENHYICFIWIKFNKPLFWPLW
jgi:hypothetical protein